VHRIHSRPISTRQGIRLSTSFSTFFPWTNIGRAGKHVPQDRFAYCVARVIQEKGLAYLLDACARLRMMGFEFCCEIIGAPEEPTYISYWIQLKRLHNQLQLQDIVAFRGAQPFENIAEAYARADLFVLPCVIAENGGRDISPNSLIEAMAMGLPVISTQLSTISEIAEDGANGMLVPPNDALALAEAMRELMRDAARRRRLSEGARLTDITPTILHLHRLPIPSGMDGRVLMELFSPEYERLRATVLGEAVQDADTKLIGTAGGLEVWRR
jgi:glycosyltransferase involved in cell wall biosynthesis